MRNSDNTRRKGLGKQAVAIIADGDTEKWYFQLMKAEEGLRLPINYPVIKGKLQDVYSQVEEQCNKPFTRIYWIIDLDVILKEERELKPNAPSPVVQLVNILAESATKHPSLTIVINNPCLEYWYLLHFKNTTKFYPTYEPELEKDLLHHLPGYKKKERYYKSSPNIYARLHTYQNDAIERAKHLTDFDLKSNRQKAQSGIWAVVQELKSLKDN